MGENTVSGRSASLFAQRGCLAAWRLGVTLVVGLACHFVVLAQSGTAPRTLVGSMHRGHVRSVTDGDTLTAILSDGHAVVVRLEGIDAPERGAPFFNEARNALRTLLFDRDVSFVGTDVDRYGRLVARVTVDGLDTSIAMISAGLACHYTRYSSDASLARAQVQARGGREGFWATGVRRPDACGAAPRGPATSDVSVEFHGNRSSKVYHRSTCRNYNCPNCVVVFHSHAEAQAAGFKPAEDCLR